MHIFTSVTANYIPKARVLAASCKKHNPDSVFILILSDALPDWVRPAEEPFDHIVQAKDLEIPDFQAWAFQHSVVELCTAVKGRACQYIHEHFGAQKIMYLDPDIAVFGSLSPLAKLLDTHDILLTPHQLEPEEEERAIIDNEICSLKHGVFNLGFLALAMRGDGLRFMDWWAARLARFCHDDIPSGLFTDQRWVDLAPCFFPRLHVLRAPNCNVATWNISRRSFSGSLEQGILVDGQPLIFYHFSGYDSGAYAIMLDVYGKDRPQLLELKAWYAEALKKAGQSEHGATPSIYHHFDNGEAITLGHRLAYRSRADLRAHFPAPFTTTPVDTSYYHWYAAHRSQENLPEGSTGTEAALRQELFDITHSRTWKVACFLKKLYHLGRRA